MREAKDWLHQSFFKADILEEEDHELLHTLTGRAIRVAWANFGRKHPNQKVRELMPQHMAHSEGVRDAHYAFDVRKLLTDDVETLY
jgi:hypothetical protein